MALRLAGLLLPIALLSGAGDPPTSPGSGGWEETRLDLDVHPDLVHQTIRITGELVLSHTGADTTGPSLRLGHDLTPFFRTPTEFMRFVRIDVPNGRAILNRRGTEPGIVWADIHFNDGKLPPGPLALSFEVELLQPSFEFVVTHDVAMGSGGVGWYPRLVPDPVGDWSSGIDSTPGVTRLHVPDGWSTIASGTFEGRQRSDGGFTESWRQDTHNARSFVLGKFHTVDRKLGNLDVRVSSLTPAMNADSLVQSLTGILRALEERFGPYPYSKYAAAEFPDSAVRWWGDALGDFQILRTSLVSASNGGFVPLSHEIGHAWWGNLIEPVGPGALIINEGMASLATGLALEGVYGRAYLVASRKAPLPGAPPDFTIANHFKLIAEGKDVALASLTEGGNDYQIAVVKGTVVLNMLRFQVGDARFFGTLKQLLRTHAHGTLSLEELRGAFLAADPSPALRQFLSQWLDRAGAPRMDTKLSCAANGSRQRTTLQIDQVQPGEPYVLDLKIRLTGKTERLDSVKVRGARTTATFDGPACFTAVELDPDRDMFIWRPEYGGDM